MLNVDDQPGPPTADVDEVVGVSSGPLGVPAPRGCQPRFSVVVPAFNEAAYLPSCLESLAQQDYPGDYEVIVVDNNSTDETAAVARRLGAVVVSEEQAGVCSARQRGTVLARGEIVISTDADTTFDRSWLSRIDESFKRNPACAAVAGPCRFVMGPLWGTLYPKALFGLVYLVSLVTGKVFYITATNFAFRKSAWSGYDTRLTQGGDELDLLRRLRPHGKVMFDPRNPTFTSPRRLNRGLFYNLTVTFFFYYLLGYWLNRLFSRQILGSAPAFRTNDAPRTLRQQLARAAAGASFCVLVVVLGRLAISIVDAV